MAIEVTENALRDYNNGDILYPEKISQIFNEQTQDRINCLPATLLKEKICGMKWVSVFPDNPIRFGCTNVSAVIVLSEIEKGYPIAFLEGTMCSALRTAAISTVAAKYLAPSTVETIGFIGSGEQAKMHFMAMKSMFKSIKICKVASRKSESEKKFVKELSNFYPDVKFELCNTDYEKATINTDIIVTAISGQTPLLKAEWIKKGCLYCHVGGWEDEYEVALKADKIVCDHWESVKHRTQTISRLYKTGKLSDEDIYSDLDKIVSGQIVGREHDHEFIYFNAVGLSYVDVALGYKMYQMALQKDKGKDWSLATKGCFDYPRELYNI
ncbi:MAG: ornithine cyclodeaminase family protein [Clostridia bacterium]|nr:ornithine cyclodeaminase family protein [Clostridia bacterium]